MSATIYLDSHRIVHTRPCIPRKAYSVTLRPEKKQTNKKFQGRMGNDLWDGKLKKKNERYKLVNQKKKLQILHTCLKLSTKLSELQTESTTHPAATETVPPHKKQLKKRKKLEITMLVFGYENIFRECKEV